MKKSQKVKQFGLTSKDYETLPEYLARLGTEIGELEPNVLNIELSHTNDKSQKYDSIVFLKPNASIDNEIIQANDFISTPFETEKEALQNALSLLQNWLNNTNLNSIFAIKQYFDTDENFDNVCVVTIYYSYS